MTMFTLPNFCRVCLKYDKNLIDLEHIENEPSETLMSKLQQCVSEVEWKVFKPLLCHPCIKRLNIAYTFKKQCVQSASMLKSYVALVKDTKIKSESQNSKGGDQNNAYMMLPNQKYIKIVVGPQSQNSSFQNVFLNVVPSPAQPTDAAPAKNSKDTNQNVFLNINNTFQKYIPVDKSKDVHQLLTESKSEELSVEIDPTDLGLGDGGTSDEEEEEECGEDKVNDWEDVIGSTQIVSPRSNGAKGGDPKSYGNYVPILPKQAGDVDKMEFFNSGQHFLSTQPYTPNFFCEACQKRFDSNILLKNHLKDFHLGKYPFKCEYCRNEFMIRAEYEACMRFHKGEMDSKTSLTLNDFKGCDDVGTAAEAEGGDASDLNCDLCRRQFNSSSGLLRHKVRKHNQKSKKKYFIKGMKNARCDICNREFSTQSYMQLHRKLHLRDDIGYKYKVFGRNRYLKNNEAAATTSPDEGTEKKSDNQEDTTSNNKDEEMAVVEEEADQEKDVRKGKSKTEDEDDDDDESDEEN